GSCFGRATFRREQRDQSVAGRYSEGGAADRDRDPEKAHPESRGPTLHRRRTRGRKLDIRRTADKANAAVHSMTSWARASTIGGTSIPIIFPALALMISSNLVGC